MPLRIGDTDNLKEGTDRRKGRFNTALAERNDDQEEQGVPYVVPKIQLRLEARTSMVYEYLLSRDRF